MLTEKQKAEIDTKVINYYYGMQKTHKAPNHIIEAWSKRYRITLEQELQKRCKP